MVLHSPRAAVFCVIFLCVAALSMPVLAQDRMPINPNLRPLQEGQLRPAPLNLNPVIKGQSRPPPQSPLRQQAPPQQSIPGLTREQASEMFRRTLQREMIERTRDLDQTDPWYNVPERGVRPVTTQQRQQSRTQQINEFYMRRSVVPPNVTASDYQRIREQARRVRAQYQAIADANAGQLPMQRSTGQAPHTNALAERGSASANPPP